MISREKLFPILASYKRNFLSIWKDEKYKWENVKYFQDRWNLEAENFGKMFEQATARTSNLLASGYAYPRAMIINFAKEDDEGTRAMFRDLADESQDLHPSAPYGSLTGDRASAARRPYVGPCRGLYRSGRSDSQSY